MIIPNHNGLALLEKHLPAAIAAAQEVGATVVLSDDASSDGSPEWVEAAFPGVEVLRSERRSGFGITCNRAAHRYPAEILALLNSDVAVPVAWIRSLLPALDDPTVFSVNPGIRVSNRPHANDGFTCFSFRHGLLTAVGPYFLSSVGAPSTVGPTGYGVGAAVLVDGQKFRAIGGFDPCLRPYYYEDADLGFSAWERGWSCLCDPRIEVLHDHQGTIGRTEPKGVLEQTFFMNRVLFTWKHISSADLILRHLVWLVRYLPTHAYRRRWPEIRGLLAAFGRAPALLPHRPRHPRLTDREVMARAQPVNLGGMPE